MFGVNYGEMGFLATVDRENADEGWRRALTGDFEMLSLPAIELSDSHGHRWLAMNDVSINRQQGNRVADLGYSVGADEVGRVRCDGLVVATPAGSTGYNLANGGPVMAWGVEGFVVSFIAPHSLTARPLVVAPADIVSVDNRSREEPVEVTVDGRPMCLLAGRREHAGPVHGQPGHARADPRHLVLQPAAPEVRPARVAAVDAAPALAFGRRLPPGRVVDQVVGCCTSFASRTCC